MTSLPSAQVPSAIESNANDDDDDVEPVPKRRIGDQSAPIKSGKRKLKRKQSASSDLHIGKQRYWKAALVPCVSIQAVACLLSPLPVMSG